MPAPVLTIAVNVTTRQFCISNGSLAEFNKLPRGIFTAKVYLRQTRVDPVPGTAETEAFNASAYDGIRLGLWQTNPGTEANVLALSDQTQWTYNQDDLANPYFTATFNTNTTEIIAWLDGKSCGDCFLDISLVSGADVSSILDVAECGETNFEILNRTDPGAGNGISVTSATPFVNLPFNMRSSTGYYTWAESSPGVLDYTYTPN